MLRPVYIRQFTKDIKIMQKRDKNMVKLKGIINLLLNELQLPIKNHNHKLKSNFKNYWECHIEPDWLLIYKKTATEIIFVRTGTHSDLF